MEQNKAKKVDSPEQLNEYIRLSNPGVWILVLAIVVLLAGFCHGLAAGSPLIGGAGAGIDGKFLPAGKIDGLGGKLAAAGNGRGIGKHFPGSLYSGWEGGDAAVAQIGFHHTPDSGVSGQVFPVVDDAILFYPGIGYRFLSQQMAENGFHVPLAVFVNGKYLGMNVIIPGIG